MLMQRIITAAVLIPLVLLGIFLLPQHMFEITTCLITVACGWEWANLININNQLEKVIFLLLIPSLCYAITWIAMGYFLYFIMLGILVLCFVIHRFESNKIVLALKDFIWYVVGLIMLVAFWYSINIIRFKIGGSTQLLMLLLVVWISDTAAYFFGKKFGRTPLAVKISPNKTWEGIKAAVYSLIFFTIIEGVLLKTAFPVFLAMLLMNFLTMIAGVYGDLFESMIKRLANQKDSGNLLPGHGGILDRLDSLFFAAPCYATCLLLTKFYFS